MIGPVPRRGVFDAAADVEFFRHQHDIDTRVDHAGSHYLHSIDDAGIDGPNPDT